LFGWSNQNAVDDAATAQPSTDVLPMCSTMARTDAMRFAGVEDAHRVVLRYSTLGGCVTVGPALDLR
jgi:hypothetical protein